MAAGLGYSGSLSGTRVVKPKVAYRPLVFTFKFVMGAAREMPGACAGPGVNYRTSKGTSESAAPPTAMPPQIVQTKFHSHSIGPSQPKLYMHSPRGKGGDQIRTASRAHTHARTLACQPTSPLAYLGVSRAYRGSQRRVGTAKSPSIQWGYSDRPEMPVELMKVPVCCNTEQTQQPYS